MLPLCLIAGVIAALSTSAGHAATFFYQQHGPAPYGAGFSEFVTPAEADIVAAVLLSGPAPPEVEAIINPRPNATATFTFVHFRPAVGEPIVPGVYHATGDPNSEGPHFNVSTADGYCDGSPGRVVLHELVADAAGTVETLSLDFELDCGYGTGVGALRFRTGDAGCADTADGAPCDDRNPCTQDDSCRAGTCEGVDVVSVTCPQSGGCAEGGTCDRRIGTCRAVERRDGAACDDGDQCTTTGVCQAGQCIGADPPDCDDGSVCTEDRCDSAVGCVHRPAPGLCLVTRPVVRSVATASASGQSVRCTLRCQSSAIWTLVLYEDGTYRSPGGPATSCPTGASVLFPDEVGTVRYRRRKEAVLVPGNLEALLRASEDCTGVRPRSYRARISVEGDGRPVDVTSVIRTRVPARAPISVTSRSHGRFVPGVGPAGAVIPPLIDSRLPICETSPKPRCVRD